MPYNIGLMSNEALTIILRYVMLSVNGDFEFIGDEDTSIIEIRAICDKQILLVSRRFHQIGLRALYAVNKFTILSCEQYFLPTLNCRWDFHASFATFTGLIDHTMIAHIRRLHVPCNWLWDALKGGREAPSSDFRQFPGLRELTVDYLISLEAWFGPADVKHLNADSIVPVCQKDVILRQIVDQVAFGVSRGSFITDLMETQNREIGLIRKVLRIIQARNPKVRTYIRFMVNSFDFPPSAQLPIGQEHKTVPDGWSSSCRYEVTEIRAEERTQVVPANWFKSYELPANY